ncbi:autophagy-related protein 18f-like isoform X2 [Carya illinoinensis]|uniref:BCAS3 domain-containing protein n=2 Tax=Carya illinoinensis TaxID=32201 RepID=A0A8T1NZ10_CARIL|nr:autophagy-related protein 18f-like isoform X2 [Carya illinoinensis]KAG6634552.1 hypothetical protein CIPAW_12G126300 [Carya illinoinensis]
MRNEGQKQQQGGVPKPGRPNSFMPSSFRAISSYLRIVSSGASTVARSAASAASSIVDRDHDASHDQVNWAGFDKLEDEGDVIQHVLLLAYWSGFQVWDVEEADNVRGLVSRHDGPVSFMQMLPKPITKKKLQGKFADSHPLLVVCTDGSLYTGSSIQDGVATPCNGNIPNGEDPVDCGFLPTAVQFYSFKSQSYVHVLKFRSVVYSVRCSSRVVAIAQAAQIHCFDTETLEREYTILTNPIVSVCPGSGGIGYGPLAVGSRWLAYSGSPVVASNSGLVSPQHLMCSASFPDFPSNGSMVAHYAKESSKQLAAGIVTLGDVGYKKLSRYCSELLPDSNTSMQSGNPASQINGTVNIQLTDAENAGMVIVRDIVSKVVIAQFRAHHSHISALCFDLSGTLLVTASVKGHIINVFKIMPGLHRSSSTSAAGASHVHLYRLQRGFTNAVIQDISFSDDSNWIMIGSSRGTSHLFAINPVGGSVKFQSADVSPTTGNRNLTKPSVNWPPNQQSLCAAGPPITLSVVSRIRNGNNGWRGTVSGAAAAATGRKSFLSGAIASSFHNCGGNALYVDCSSSKATYHFMVFFPSSCLTQYMLQTSTCLGPMAVVPGLSSSAESAPECDARLVIEAVQKWNICLEHNRKGREDNTDIYGENQNLDGTRIYFKGVRKGNSIHPEAGDIFTKAKTSSEEKHHLYISEAELQMHEPRAPLWAKPEIYFQSMMVEGSKMDEENVSGGEFETERIPTHTIEARSKGLFPAFEYLPTPKIQQTSKLALDSNVNGRIQHQRSGLAIKFPPF